MRLLLDTDDDVFEVMEVQDVSYASCESGEQSGLAFEDFDSCWWIIPGLSKNTCKEIISGVFHDGFADLTMFPVYEELLPDENNANSNV